MTRKTDSLPGTPALQDMLARYPAMAWELRELRKSREEYFAAIEAKLRESREVRAWLDNLEREGADRQTIVRLVARILPPKRAWLDEMKRRNERQRRLAKSLRKLADETERAYSDPANYPEAYGVALQTLDKFTEPPAPRESIAMMRAMAAELDERAKELGRLSKGLRVRFPSRYGLEPLITLLAHVYTTTGNPRLEWLEYLLANAWDLLGHESDALNVDNLRQIFNRHVSPRLKSRQP